MSICDEHTYPLSEASAFCGGARPSVATMVRWWKKGIGKGRAKLECVKVTGGGLRTSREAIRRFEERRAIFDAAADDLHIEQIAKAMPLEERQASLRAATDFLCGFLGVKRSEDGRLVREGARVAQGHGRRRGPAGGLPAGRGAAV